MGNLHWLVLIPYYFFSALCVLLLLIVVCRLLRVRIGANALVITSVLVAAGGVLLPLATGWAHIADYGGIGLVVLGVVSFMFAALDAWLEPRLALPLDQELLKL